MNHVTMKCQNMNHQNMNHQNMNHQDMNHQDMNHKNKSYKQKRYLSRLYARILFFAAFVVPLVCSGTTVSQAWAEESGSGSGSCTLQILYEDLPESGHNTGDPVSGAEFTLYRVTDIGDIGSPGRQLISGTEANEETDPSAIAQAVQDAYSRGPAPEGGALFRAETGADGRASVGEMPPGIYLVIETRPAEKHFAAKPFLVTLPYTSEDGTELLYTRTAEPKSVPAGELAVSKTVAGSAGEKDREFHFRVTIGGTAAAGQEKSGAGTGNGQQKNSLKVPEALHYTRSDGTGGEIKNGGTVTLRSGQSAVFDMLPAGISYTVREEEAGKDGYVTKAEGDTGVIRRTVRAEASFKNTREKTDAASASRTKGQAVQTGDSFLLLAAGALIFLTLFGAIMRKKC